MAGPTKTDLENRIEEFEQEVELLTNERNALRKLEQGLLQEVADLKRSIEVFEAAEAEAAEARVDFQPSKLERRFMETFEAAARVRPRMPNPGKRQLDDAILRFIEVVEGGRGGPGLRQQWFWPGETAQEG